MLKRIGKLIISVAVLCSMTVNVLASVKITLRMDKKNAEPQVQMVDGRAFVSLSEIFNLYGVEVEWDNGTVTAFKNGEKIRLSIGSTEASIGEERVIMEAAPFIENGRTMVPLAFVSRVLDEDISWDETTKTVLLHTREQEAPVQEETASVVQEIEIPRLYEEVLLYDDAVSKAVKNNSNLQTLKDTVELMRDSRNRLGQNLTTQYSDNTSSPFFVSATDLSILSSILSMDLTISSSRYNEEVLRNTSEALVRSSFASIESTKIDMALMEQSLKIGQENLNAMKAKLDLGMESQNNYEKEKLSYEQSKKNLETLKILLETEYVSLNHLMGVNAKERYEVDFNVSFNPYKTIDINRFVYGLLSSDPYLKTKEDDVKMAEFALSAYSYTPTDSYASRENNLKSAQRALADTTSNMEKNIRASYNRILQLEQNYKQQEIDLQKAEKDYNTIRIQYDLGNVTALNVEQAKLAVLNAKSALQKSAYTHANLVFAFERPYLLTN